MKSAIYVRVSTDEQALKGHSLEAQQDLCMKFIQDRKYELYDIYIDDGYSAKDMKRPALQRMLEDVKAKNVDFIVFWNTDRLTRDTVDGLLMCREMFFKKGIGFASMTEEIDLSTADGEMMFTIRLSMAQAERRRIGERTTIGFAKRAQKGFRNTPAPPYGYDVGPNLVLTVNDEQKRVVLMIVEWYMNGWGLTRIARELNVLGIPGPRGGQWNHVALKHMLASPTYTGHNHWKARNAPEEQRIITMADHEPILSEETYEAIQEITQRRSTGSMSRSSYDFYFSSILKCSICGRAFHGKIWQRGEKKEKRYKCSGKSKFGDCNASEISERKVVQLVMEHMIPFVEKEYNAQAKLDIGEQVDYDKERKRLEREIAKSKEVQSKLVDLLSSGRIDNDIYDSKRDAEKNKVNELQEQLDKLPTTQPQRSRTRADAIRMLREIKLNWPHMTEENRKIVMQQLYEEIRIQKVNGEWQIVDMATTF